jgi:hypothetical protein
MWVLKYFLVMFEKIISLWLCFPMVLFDSIIITKKLDVKSAEPELIFARDKFAYTQLLTSSHDLLQQCCRFHSCHRCGHPEVCMETIVGMWLISVFTWN